VFRVRNELAVAMTEAVQKHDIVAVKEWSVWQVHNSEHSEVDPQMADSIVDLANPGGSKDEDHDQVDDRLLGSVALEAGGQAAGARRVAFYQDDNARPIVAVAAGKAGVFLVQVGPPRITLNLTAPTPNQEFHMDMVDPTMPDHAHNNEVKLQLRVKPRMTNLTYNFRVGNPTNGHAMEYEDKPNASYADPATLDSGLPSALSEWAVDFGPDIYGGHVTHVTATVSKNGTQIAQQTFARDFFVLATDCLCSYSRTISSPRLARVAWTHRLFQRRRRLRGLRPAGHSSNSIRLLAR
jgi:hypothetical protein